MSNGQGEGRRKIEAHLECSWREIGKGHEGGLLQGIWKVVSQSGGMPWEEVWGFRSVLCLWETGRPQDFKYEHPWKAQPWNSKGSSVVGIFPSTDSHIRLITSYLLEYSDDWQTECCYMNAGSIKLQKEILFNAAWWICGFFQEQNCEPNLTLSRIKKFFI